MPSWFYLETPVNKGDSNTLSTKRIWRKNYRLSHGHLYGAGHVRQREKAGQEGKSSRPALFYPNASPAQRVAFGNGGTVKGASFAHQGEASDLELAPTKVKLERAQGECLGIRSRRRT